MEKAGSTISPYIKTKYEVQIISYNIEIQYGEFHSSGILKSGKEYEIHFLKI